MKICFPNNKDVQLANKIAEDLFKTETDETQAQPTMANSLAVINLDKNNFICFKEKNKIIAWSVVLPTSISNMKYFLDDQITEKTLLEKSISQPSFEALYIMGIIVLPQYRKKGLATKLLENQINYFSKEFNINNFYSMIFSKEGSLLMGNIINKMGIKINCKNV